MSSHIPHLLSFPEPADRHSPSLEQLSLACSSQVHKTSLIMLGRWHKKVNEDGKSLETRKVREKEVWCEDNFQGYGEKSRDFSKGCAQI